MQPTDDAKRLFDSEQTARAAGISQQCLLGWRRRRQLLGGPRGGQTAIAYAHTLIDVLIVAAVAAMTRRGIEVADAISAEPELHYSFAALLEDHGLPARAPHRFPPIFGFHAKGRDRDTKLSIYHLQRDATLGAVLDRSPTGSLQLLDLERIVADVRRSLSGVSSVRFIVDPPSREAAQIGGDT